MSQAINAQQTPPAAPVVPSQREIDESFFAATLDKIEQWLATHEPGPELRRVLLRASSTLFAGWGDVVNGD